MVAVDVFNFGGGTKLAFVGFTTDPRRAWSSRATSIRSRSVRSLTTVNAEAARFAKKPTPIVALGHEGATAGTRHRPDRSVVDLADSVANVDAVIGDHNDLQVRRAALERRPGHGEPRQGPPVHADAARVGPADGVVYKTADYHKPWDIGLTPDPAIQAEIDDLNAQLAPILNTKSATRRSRSRAPTSAAMADGRLCESLVGNVVTDAMRTTYSPIGVDFAITNSGGLRADLTCPDPDIAGDFCPTLHPRRRSRSRAASRWPCCRSATSWSRSSQRSRAQDDARERCLASVGAAPDRCRRRGRFPQVSGLCFSYNVAAASGSRVTGAVLQAADGSCTGAAVDLTRRHHVHDRRERLHGERR